MKYGLKLDNPKEFYHELHRPVHFINFTSQVKLKFCFLHVTLCSLLFCRTAVQNSLSPPTARICLLNQ